MEMQCLSFKFKSDFLIFILICEKFQKIFGALATRITDFFFQITFSPYKGIRLINGSEKGINNFDKMTNSSLCLIDYY